MTEYEVRNDGIANCHSTVTKDCLVAEEQPKTRIRELKDGFSSARNDAKGSTVQGSKVTYDTAETIDTITRSFQGMVSEKAMDAPIEVKDGTMYNPYNRSEIKDVAPTQTANCGSSTSSAMVARFEQAREEKKGHKKVGYYEKNGKLYKVRKLTPKESFRLMGWKDERIDLILNAKDEKGKRLISDSAGYFLCGNSIIIQHLMGIFGQLFRVKWKKKVFGSYENPHESEQLNLFDLIKPEEEFYENWPEFDSIKD